MKLHVPVRSGIAPTLVTALVFACANDSPPVAPDTDRVDVASPQLATDAGGAHLLVIQVEEYDWQADGVIERRGTSRTSFDARGNAVRNIFEHDMPAGGPLESRTTTASVYDEHDNLVRFESKLDGGCDGTTNSWNAITTVERDGHGNPVRQLWASDYDSDGTIDSQSEIVNEFDNKGHLIRTVLDEVTRTFAYDAHDNRVLSVTEFPPLFRRWEVVSSYNAHDALIHQVEQVFADGAVASVSTLSTLAYDRQGNPIRQEAVGTSSRALSTSEYDSRHRLLKRTVETDGRPFGTIDSRTTTSYQFVGAGEAKPGPDSQALRAVAGSDGAVVLDPFDLDRAARSADRLRRQ